MEVGPPKPPYRRRLKTTVRCSSQNHRFNELVENGATAAACWAHVHCYFEDAWKNDPAAAELPMGIIKSLFDIERLAITLPEAERNDLRQRLAKPKIATFKDWIDEIQMTEPPKTQLGDAISYTLNRWPALLVYLDHPYVLPDKWKELQEAEKQNAETS